SSDDLSGRSADLKPSFNEISFGYSSRMESSIIVPGSGLPGLCAYTSDAPPGSTRLGLRQVAGNAQGVSQCAVVNRRWIQAPNRGQQQDFFRIGAAPLDLGEVILGVAFTVIVASKAEFSFGPGLAALVPHRFAGPRVAADGAAALEPRPGMVSDRSIHTEKLHFTQFPTQPLQESETGVYVLAWLRQKRADHQDPATDRRGNEQFLPAALRHPFGPRAGSGIVQPKRGLHRLQVCALDGHPAVGTLKNRGLKKTVAVKLCLRLLARAGEQLSPARPEIPPDNDDQHRP